MAEMNTQKIKYGIPQKRNAVIIPAGRNSLHKQLVSVPKDFDLHLLVYDGSYDDFYDDTDFVCSMSGYKMDMSYRYFKQHPELLSYYDYCLFLDDDIRITAASVDMLFNAMRTYRLKIAQPALRLSYATYDITLYDPTCHLRYTDFVEMMMPCFSREALMAVLPTFKEKVRWRGIEFHWPVLIGTNHEDMAIIDGIKAVHTRQLQSYSHVYWKIMDDYMKQHSLKMNENVYGRISCDEDVLRDAGYAMADSHEIGRIREKAEGMVASFFANNKTVPIADLPYLSIALFTVSFITEKRKYHTAASLWLNKLLDAVTTRKPILCHEQKHTIETFRSILLNDITLKDYDENISDTLSTILSVTNTIEEPSNSKRAQSAPYDFMKSIISLCNSYNTKLSPLLEI